MSFAQVVVIKRSSSNPRTLVPCIRISRAIEQAVRTATWPSGSGFRIDLNMMYFTSTGYNGYTGTMSQFVSSMDTHSGSIDERSVVVDGTFTIPSTVTPPDAGQDVAVTAQLVFVTSAGAVIPCGDAELVRLKLA